VRLAIGNVDPKMPALAHSKKTPLGFLQRAAQVSLPKRYDTIGASVRLRLSDPLHRRTLAVRCQNERRLDARRYSPNGMLQSTRRQPDRSVLQARKKRRRVRIGGIESLEHQFRQRDVDRRTKYRHRAQQGEQARLGPQFQGQGDLVA
jgi:hypothetical protein